MLRSMTAFISDVFSLSETSKYPSADITYEIKGLNNKFLDISFKSNFNFFLPFKFKIVLLTQLFFEIKKSIADSMGYDKGIINEI